MPADEKDSAATNRLLDLLRAQQAGKPTTEGNASGTIDAQDNKSTESEHPSPSTPPAVEPEAEKPLEAKPKAEQPAPVFSSSIVPDAIVDEKPPAADSSKPVSSEEILAKLGRIGKTKDQDEAPKVEETEKSVPGLEKTEALIRSETPVAEDTQEKTVPEPDHTEQAPDDTQHTDEAEEIEREPDRLDPQFFAVHKSAQPPNKILDVLYEISNWAYGIRRKITVQCTSTAVRIMKIQTVGKRNVIHAMEEYKLPFEVGDEKITHRDDLLAYVLDKLDPKAWKKDTMFRMYSSQLETQTKVFKAPPVKGKELDELISWTAKKNLPFSSENIHQDHLIQESEKGEMKKNIIIGVGNGEMVDHLTEIYRKRKFDLQTVTTIPFLDWETFKHCYPDRQRGCIAIIHIAWHQTTITMVRSGRLEFNREMAVGIKDYQKSLIQRVMVGNDAVNIDETMAEDYLLRYGIPLKTDEDIPESGISLYKISIFLRPIIERMTGEINRSLDYFKKQVVDAECQEVYFTGPGAAIPNLVQEFQERLGRTCEYLNPLRQGDFEIGSNFDLNYQDIPTYATNFSLALDYSSGINLLPKERKQHFQYRIFNKLAFFVAGILLPLYLMMAYFTYSEAGMLEESVVTMNQQWQRLSEQSQEYFIMLDDLEYLGNYWGYLNNDRVNSQNQMRLLRLLSSEMPANIKITSLVFVPASSKEEGKAIQQDAHIDKIALSGFVEAHAGVADIQLTNFIMRLEGLNVFTNIDREVRGNPSSDDSRLFFTLKMGIDIR